MTPVSTAPSLPASQFTVCTSGFARSRIKIGQKYFCQRKFLRVRRGCQASQRKGLTSGKLPGKSGELLPEGLSIEKIQSREAILKKSSFQYGMKFSIENGIFIPGPSLAAEKQGLGLKFSIENEIFKPRMKISSENENFVRGGMFFFFFMRSSENDFFQSSGPLGRGSLGNFQGTPRLLLSSTVLTERTSGEVAEKLPGKFGEPLGKSGDMPEARGSLTPSQRLAKFVKNICKK